MSETVPYDQTASIDTGVFIGDVRLRCPVLLASGTCGYGPEYADLIDFSRIGGLFTKSITLEPRRGNPPPRIVETASGILNAIGLANVGLEAFVREKVPAIKDLPLAVFVNVAGSSIEEYETICGRLDAYECIAGFELNVSCPNVKDGLAFGTDAARLYRLVRQVRRRVERGVLIVKLSPNVTDIAEIARAAVEAGADALSVANTYAGMAIDIQQQRPALANVTGGLSGPAIKPLAILAVWRVYTQVAKTSGTPIIGLGGITCWQDAVEFILAGASAVAIGTATFLDPAVAVRVAEGLESWLRREGYLRLADAVGKAA